MRRLGLVLGGGGVRGLAHIGVLTSLQAAGIAPHALVGVSMGAVVAATYAARADWRDAFGAVERSTLPALAQADEDALLGLRNLAKSARLLAPSLLTWTRRGGVLDFSRQTLQELLGADATFAGTRIPLAVTGSDLHTAERVVLREGDLTKAVLASFAIPGIAQPVRIGAHTLVDGGFADPSPIDVARDLGAEIVVAVHVGQHLGPFDADTWLGGLIRSFEVGQRAFAKERLRHADLVVRPDFGERVPMLDFSATEEAIACGSRATDAALEEIRTLLAGPEREATSSSPAPASDRGASPEA